MSETDDRRSPRRGVSPAGAHGSNAAQAGTKPLGGPPGNALDQSLPAAAEGGPSFHQTEVARAPAPLEEKLVFVIMPLKGDGMDEVNSAIQKECRALGLRSTRVDETVGSGLVIKKIAYLIEAAEFIVCDLTHERPNVYYELGYAHGVGNQAVNTLLIAREGTRLHFDLAGLNVEHYASIDELRLLLARRFAQMVRTIPIVSTFFGIVIRMYYRENEPRHFHAEFHAQAGKFNFDGVQIEGNITSPNALHLICKWAVLNKAALDANWSKIKASEPLSRIPPLK